MCEALGEQTQDHTLAQQYLNQGLISSSEAKTWPGRNMLLRALGIQRNIDPEVTEIKPESNQLFILCSDGLTDAVSEAQIRSTIKKGLEAEQPLQRSIDDLIKLANRNGGPDNISIVMVRVTRSA